MFRQLVAGLSPYRPTFNCRPVSVGFVVYKVALRQVFIPVLVLSPVRFRDSVLIFKLLPNLFCYIMIIYTLLNPDQHEVSEYHIFQKQGKEPVPEM